MAKLNDIFESMDVCPHGFPDDAEGCADPVRCLEHVDAKLHALTKAWDERENLWHKATTASADVAVWQCQQCEATIDDLRGCSQCLPLRQLVNSHGNWVPKYL